MAEDRKELSVDEILESIKQKRSGGSLAVEDIFEEKNEYEEPVREIMTDDDGDMDSSTVFGDYDSDESYKPVKPSDTEVIIKPAEPEAKIEEPISKEEVSKEPTSEYTESATLSQEQPEPQKPSEPQEETSPDDENGNAGQKTGSEEEKPNVPSFKELFTKKKIEKERAGKTRAFKKPEPDSAADDGKTKIISEENAEISQEDELEKQFNEARQEKIDRFRLFTESITDSPIAEEEELVSPSVLDSVKMNGEDDIFTAVDKVKKPKKENTKRNELIKKRNSKVYEKIDVGRVKLRLKNESEKQKVRLIILTAAFAATFITEIIKAVYTSGKLEKLSVVMADKCVIFYAFSLVLALLPFAAALSAFIEKLRNSEKFEFTNELYLLLVSVVNIFHSSVMLSLRQPVGKETLTFTLPVCFVALMSAAADMRENKMILKNLNTITKNERLLGIYPLTKNAEKLAGGISSSKEPNILCAGEVEVPDSFMDSSTVKDKQNAYLRVIIPLLLVCGAVSGSLAAFTYGGVRAFSLGMISTILLCCPAFLTTVLTSLISNTNDKLNISGCEILGYEAVEYIDDTDAIVLDTADIFSGEISHFHIINSRAGVSTLSAFQTVCAMLSSSGGVLSKEVENLMKEQNLDLPEIEDMKYEEKLGLSGWANNKCVLLGTRQMMINHNMEVPPEYTEKGYLDEGKRVFYFAVDTQVVAMFCAEYFIGRQAKKQLEKLYKTGVILMLMTTDPNIDEEFVATTLGVNPDSIKTVSSTGTKTIRKEIDKTAKQKRTGLIFKRNITGSLRVINAAFRLYDVQSLTMLIQSISMFFALVLTLVLNIVATKYFVNEWIVMGYHAIWTVIALIVTSRK